MKIVLKIIFRVRLLISVLAFGIFKQSDGQEHGMLPTEFRIIGYLRITDIENDNASSIDLSKVNYLNIAFINPFENGNFPVLTSLNSVVASAHNKRVKVLSSLGKGLAPTYYSLLLSDDNRNSLIKNIVQFVSVNQYDGVDVNLESEHIDAHFEIFISELSFALKPQNKLLRAAVATAYQSRYPDKALSLFNFINIMSYDKTDPWKPESSGQHSPYDLAVEDLDYWTHTIGIPKEKLNLGMAFYGYGFGQDSTEYISYKNTTNLYPLSADQDELTVAEGGVIYYNGTTTIENKTTLALKKADRIMVWQLLQDPNWDNSLLNTINKGINNYRR